MVLIAQNKKKILMLRSHITVSTRTPEDDAKEKELLKRLVEIVEEKSDIVENLNKDTSW